MDLPFSREQFFDVMAQYNVATWPAHLGLTAFALACLVAVFVQRGWDRAIAWTLALLWAWMASAYHFAFFTTINPAAWGFGAAYLVAAWLFVRHAGSLRFEYRRSAALSAGLALIAYALVGYPMANWLTGHEYPRTPTFGLPCPTTIFTLGVLLLARPPVPISLFVVPFAWSLVGTVAAFQLDVAADYGLLAAALLTAIVLAARARVQPTRARCSST